MKKLTFTLIYLTLLLTLRAQLFYGTTYRGGSNDRGVIFSFDGTTGSYTKLREFGLDDGRPIGTLVQAPNGKFYGMTVKSFDFMLDPAIYSFDPATDTYTKVKIFSGLDGYGIQGSLTLASNGKLYGITRTARSEGFIFSFDPATNKYTKLQNISGSGDLMQASDGKLYGVSDNTGHAKGSIGLLFSFDLSTNKYTIVKELVYGDGERLQGRLVQASDGKLYGMMARGGRRNLGLIFSFDPTSKQYENLKSFTAADNKFPTGGGGLVQASDGKLYGSLQFGGIDHVGAIFSFDPATHKYTKLKDFHFEKGAVPNSSLLQAPNGKLYGVTTYGGSSDSARVEGVIFSYDPITNKYEKLKTFDNFLDGAGPYSSSLVLVACAIHTYYRDADGDGHGDAADKKMRCSSVVPDGYVNDSTDCDDTKASIYPGATEICGNGTDDNCNGLVDEGCADFVSSFTLINTSTDKGIQPLKDGDVLDLTKLPRTSLNIRANTMPSNVGSVVFELKGARQYKHTENGAPFALFGDNKRDYFGSPLPEGEYTLTATPFNKDNGKGTKGTPLTVHFKVVYPVAITRFTLVNARTGEAITEVKEGGEINLATLPTKLLSIRATTSPDTVGSVLFALSGQQIHRQTENLLPYSLFGDSTRTYTAWVPKPGNYTLTATPYSGAKGYGTKGKGYSVHFTVVDPKQNECTTPGFALPVTTATDLHRYGTAADFNGDGKPDLAISNSSTGGIVIYVGNGNGGFTEGKAYLTDNYEVFGLIAGDLNRDGKVDLVVSNRNFGGQFKVSVLPGNGDGSFGKPVSYASGGNFPSRIMIADFNKDDKPDLAVSNSNSRSVGILLGKGDGGFNSAVAYPTSLEGDALVSADFDKDGNPDIAVTDFFTGTFGMLLGKGDGTFSQVTTHPSGGFRTYGAATADFNNDGKPDLAVTNFATNNMSVLLGRGDGTFSQPVLYPTGENFPAEIVASDLNGDGKQDLVVEKWEGQNIVVFMGKGDGNFDQGITVSENGSTRWLAVADFNTDDRPDIGFGFNFNAIHVLLNTCGAGTNSTLTRTLQKPVLTTTTETGKTNLAAYPNPFNSQSTIRFSIPASGSVTLGVYNATGTEVTKLYKGRAEAGKEYRVSLEGKHLPAGVYLVKLTTNDTTTSLKLLLVR